MSQKVYIRAASQISIQEPLSSSWQEEPLTYSEGMHHCLDPDWSQFFTPMQSRRMGNLMKRALATSLQVIRDSGIENPDAIVTGTGLGCIENTEIFLGKMCREGEEMLPPTQFMQSTHNTIGSLVAINIHCTGYNCTYSQDTISFESALLDAFLQMKSGEIATALAGSHDEITDTAFYFLRKSGWIGPKDIASEGSAALMLSTSPEKTLCEIADVQIMHAPEDIQSVVASFGAEHVLKSKEYLNIFGKNFSTSGLACVAAAELVANGRYSDILIVNDLGTDLGLVHLKRSCGN
jgi:3-oxoacyl-[acyl-carrier-protein] synthase II